MKKTIYFLTAFTCLISGYSYGQTSLNRSERTHNLQSDSDVISTEVIWIDLCDPQQASITRSKGSTTYNLSSNHNFAFGIKNINQYKFDYTINSIPFSAFVDTNYGLQKNSSITAFNATINNFYQMQQYQNLSTNRKTISNYLDSLDKLKSQNTALYHLLDKDTKQDSIKKHLDKINSNWNNYDRIHKKLQDIGVLFNIRQQATSIKNILDKLQKIEAECRNAGMQINDSLLVLQLKTNILSFLNPVYNGRAVANAKFNTVNTLKAKYDTILDISNANLHKIEMFYYQTTIITNHCLNRFEMLYDSLDNILSHTQCLESAFSKPNEKNKIFQRINFFTDVKEVVTDLKNFYTFYEMDTQYLGYLNTQMDNLQQKLFQNLNNISKILNFRGIYIIPTPSNMKNIDQINITVVTTDRNTHDKQSYEYDIFLKGGLKFDFSAGIFGSMLKNNTYVSTSVLDASNKPTDFKVIRSQNNGSMDVGFGGMVNISIRTGTSWVTPGVSFGLNISTQPSYQFLSAFTLGIGKTERILIHAGVAAGFVKRIDGLDLNTSIPSEKIGDVVPTIDRFLVKPFIGLSYNLSKNKVFNVTSFKAKQAASE